MIDNIKTTKQESSSYYNKDKKIAQPLIPYVSILPNITKMRNYLTDENES